MDESTLKRYKKFALILTLVMFLRGPVVGYMRYIYPPLLPLIQQDLQMTSSQAGLLQSAFLLMEGIMLIPAGIIVDRKGPRWALIFVSFIQAFAIILFGLARQFSVALLAQALTGLTSSFGLAGALSFTMRWFPSKRRATITGIWAAGPYIGLALSARISPQIAQASSWSMAFYIPAVIGLVTGVIVWLIIRDNPEDRGLPSVSVLFAEKTDVSSPRRGAAGRPVIPTAESLVSVFKNRYLWLINIVLLLSMGVLNGGLTWTPALLNKFVGFTLTDGGKIVAATYLVAIVANPTGGWMADRFGRKRTAILGLLIDLVFEIIFVVLILRPGAPFGTLLLMRLLASVFGAGFFYFPNLVIAAETGGVKYAGVSVAISQMFAAGIGGAIMSALGGVVLDTVGGWTTLWWFFIIFQGMAAVLQIFVREPKAVPVEEVAADRIPA